MKERGKEGKRGHEQQRSSLHNYRSVHFFYFYGYFELTNLGEFGAISSLSLADVRLGVFSAQPPPPGGPRLPARPPPDAADGVPRAPAGPTLPARPDGLRPRLFSMI